MTEGIINEDDEFFMRLFFHAKKIYYIPFAHYLYTLCRPGSVTTLNMFATMKMVDAAKKQFWFGMNSVRRMYVVQTIGYLLVDIL